MRGAPRRRGGGIGPAGRTDSAARAACAGRAAPRASRVQRVARRIARFPAAFLLLPAFLLALGCADTAPTRDVRATVVDEAGRPIPEAIFYAEVREDDAAFAFVWAVVGEAGEVPDSAYEPLKIPWRSGARVSLAAFAPGHQSAVVRIDSSTPRTDGILLTLPRAESPWNAELALLSAPFEGHPELAAEFGAAAQEPLRAAFRTAWADRPEDSLPPSEGELRKLSAFGLR